MPGALPSTLFSSPCHRNLKESHTAASYLNPACVWLEPTSRILGCHTALDGTAIDAHVLLLQAQLWQTLPLSDVDLGMDKIHTAKHMRKVLPQSLSDIMEDSDNVLSPQQTAATQLKGRGKRSCKTKGSVQEAADKIRAKARANRKARAEGQDEHRLHSTLAKQIEKTSKDQVNSLQLSPPKENRTSQSPFSQVESDMDNLGQVATNIRDSEMPGCSYWSNPIPMAHSLPGPIQNQHTKTEGQLMPLVVQQWFTQLIGQGMIGGFQMTNTMQADSRVDSLHRRKHFHPPGLTLRTRTCSPATSEDEHSNCLVEEGEIDSLSEEETEPEIKYQAQEKHCVKYPPTKIQDTGNFPWALQVDCPTSALAPHPT
ncbi:hypothetical protein E2320_013682 [Naja naja]|nr:hypothetical protein E2320_013682 [Naja naja]